MSLTGYLQVYITALCCIAIGAQAPCDRPERTAEEELQGTWDKDSYDHGTIASYICRPGYSRLGAIKKQCDNGKWKYLARGLCKKKSCGHPGDIPNGSFELDGENEFVFGVIVTYSCDSGYQMVSKVTTRTCTANGWSNFLPNCEAKNCPPVELTEGVEIVSSYDDEYTVGKVIRFQCKNPKFKLNGVAEIFCTSEGDWNAPPPECEEIKCSAPVLPNGRINARKETYYLDDKLLYVCNGNYKKERSIDPVCTKNGWAPEPTCNEITCTADYVPNGSVKNKKIMYRLGDTIELECKYGFVLDKPDEPRICTFNGWSLPLACMDKICDRPFIQNGRLYSEMNFPAQRNTVLWYTCNDNFDPLDKIYYSWSRIYYGKSICTENGWDPKPKCFALCWDSSARVDYADIYHTKRRYMEGERVKFQCYGDRRSEDGRNGGDIECLPNHKFSEARCLREGQSCGPPPVIQFGDTLQTREPTNKHGTKMTYKCPEYYLLEGNKEVVCRNGKWDDPPICIEPCTTSERDMQANNIQLKWIRDKKYYSRHNEWVGFACLYGYEISDEKLLRIQCNRSVLPYPKCTKIGSCLLSLIAMDEKNIVVNGSTEIEDRKRANFLCKEGWIPIDTMTQVCKNKNINYPTCRRNDSCQISQEQLDENGLELDSKDKASVYFEDGEFIQFKCKTGLTITTGTVGLCAKTQITYPKCTNVEICRISQYQLDKNGLELDFKDKASVFFEHGDLIQFKCKTGFAITTGTMGLCAKTQITYPRCTKI